MPDDQEQYKRLLTKYLKNECTTEEQALIERWLNAQDETLPMPTPVELEALAKKNWLPIARYIGQKQVPVYQLPVFFQSRLLRVAAVVAGLTVLVGTGWYISQQTRLFSSEVADKSDLLPGWTSNINTTARPQEITLHDGSIVTLQPHSQLKYPTRFDGPNRSVTLTGKAFFEVKRDPSHPFYVQTKSVVVKVLGTSFTVKAFSTQTTTEVSVQSGRVEVVRKKDNANMLLLPNERLAVSEENRPFVKSLVTEPVVVDPDVAVNQFNFVGTPVVEVFTTLERAYHVPIQFDPVAFTDCSLTAQLSDQPLFTKLDMICASIGASYTVQGTQIVVRGAGCKGNE